ncbi:MAG TPA: tyrosine-type recombinase/integrase [Nocardioides sp.]|nr:tyrosine-type recombinase/integrase [Nocardioides sp.]
MTGGRPRTSIGTYGAIHVRRRGSRSVAETRIRDVDGRLRRVAATADSPALARALLKERLLDRSGYGAAGRLTAASRFGELVALWTADLERRELRHGTRENYLDTLRLHVQPAFEHFTLGEITTGRVEWFLKAEGAISYSRASHSRTVLNLLFGFALRQDALARNPVEGTSQLRKPKNTPQALTPDQIVALRRAAAAWRTGTGFMGPRSDGQVRDIVEVLLGTGMRPGEALALRPCDVTDGPNGMVVRVTGTVVQRKATGVIRQAHPKTESSVRNIPVPEFAAVVIRERLRALGPADRERTIFANRKGGPLNPYNVRRTFREMVELAGLGDTGISLRWYRRTAATVIARGLGSDAAATFLGHTSTAITEGHYIEPDRTIDRSPAALLERTLRAEGPDRGLLASPVSEAEEEQLAELTDETSDALGETG